MLLMLFFAAVEVLLGAFAMQVFPMATGATLVVVLFFSRHVLAWLAAAMCAKRGNEMGFKYSVLVVGLALISFHSLYIWKSQGMLELWPPILMVDILFFLVVFPIWRARRLHQK